MKNLYYNICKFIASIIFPKREVIYEQLPQDDEASIFVCNHSGMVGPVNMTLYFDRPARPWIASYMFDKEITPNYVFHDFFFARGKKVKWFWRGLSHVVAGLVRPLLEHQNSIHVYKISAKARETFDESVKALVDDNDNVIIFPECPVKYSKFICEFYDGFVQLGKYYYDRTGKCLKFYPVYVPPKIRTINVGAPICYNPEVSPKENRVEIAKALTRAVDKIASALPEHKPIPYLTDDFYKYYGEYIDNMDEYWELVSQKHSN